MAQLRLRRLNQAIKIILHTSFVRHRSQDQLYTRTYDQSCCLWERHLRQRRSYPPLYLVTIYRALYQFFGQDESKEQGCDWIRGSCATGALRLAKVVDKCKQACLIPVP